MWRWIKCRLGYHRWKTPLGTAKEIASRYPVCAECGDCYKLTWGQSDEVHKLRKQIREARERISDIYGE